MKISPVLFTKLGWFFSGHGYPKVDLTSTEGAELVYSFSMHQTQLLLNTKDKIKILFIKFES